PGEPAGHQGRRRDRHHCLDGGGGERRARRAGTVRDQAPRHAIHARQGVGSDPVLGPLTTEATMYPAPFEYHVPSTVAEAVALLGRWQDDAKLIAGSQSLVPMMKLRLTQPKHVIDLRKVPGPTGISESEGALVIGGMTTHWQMESSSLLKSKCPILAETAAMIGDPAVRNLGTIGGSLAHADP